MSEQSQNETPGERGLLDRLGFLLGQWQAVSKPGEPVGGFTFTLQLQSRVIVRTNYADYPAANERPAFRHEDLMVIYEGEDHNLQADYYDSEGHVIHYAGEALETHQVSFTSKSTISNPGFRLRYHMDDNGHLIGSFEIAPPNQSETFMPYLNWSAVRKQESRS